MLKKIIKSHLRLNTRKTHSKLGMLTSMPSAAQEKILTTAIPPVLRYQILLPFMYLTMDKITGVRGPPPAPSASPY